MSRAFASWKMIPNCPGRYTIRHSRKSPMQINGIPVTEIATKAFVETALAPKDDAEARIEVEVHELTSERCKDAVRVAVFPGGGGVISYCKIQEDHENGEMLFIHTFNTASGLKRKLEGLSLAHVLGDEHSWSLAI